MTREERKIWYYNQIHKTINDVEYKLCSECKEWFPMNEDYFYKWKYSTTDGYRSICKKCDIKRTQQNRENNIEVRKEYDKLNHIKNQEKRNKKSVQLYEKQS
jgi:hypothetical protein